MDGVTEAREIFSYAQNLRRDFHRHPELGFQEIRTAGIIADELRKENIEVTTGVARTGVVGLIEGDHPGTVLLVRFDMDALPVSEETNAEYASEKPGVMHACGHDGHVAVGLAVAKILSAKRKEINGTVKIVFQPAEEGLGGAERMIAAGVLENPKPDRTLSLHIWNEKPIGWVGVVPGPLMSGSDIFTIRLIGKGGHGGIPDQTVDPIVCGAAVVQGIQTITARNISPLQSAVVSITQFHGGDAFNIIPSSVELKGTIRTFENQVREKVIRRMEEIIHLVSDGYGCKGELEVQRLTPPVVNDEALTQSLAEIIRSKHPEFTVDTTYRSMVSEDMAFMMEHVPGCYLMIGSANVEKHLDFSHHHPKFDFDEEVLPIAAGLIVEAVINILKS